MAEIVEFPRSSKQKHLCGDRSPLGVIVHVWDEAADIGDPCLCASRVPLPDSARPLLLVREPGDLIEADER